MQDGLRAKSRLDPFSIRQYPELVAERIVRFAKIVGRENVIAGADCGFAASALRFNDTHPSVAWLKFAALAEGARLATGELWRG